jgi:homogentisate 1,2-dioxygenase
MESPSNLYWDLKYHNGLGNGFATEALPGAIPVGTNPFIKVRIAQLS